MAEALAEDIVEIEAVERVSEMEEAVEEAVTLGKLVLLAEDVDMVIEEVVVAGAELEELEIDEDAELEVVVVVVTGLIELNLPGRRFR